MPWPEPESYEFSPSVATIPSRDSVSFQTNLLNCSTLFKTFDRYTPNLLFRDVVVEQDDNYPVFSGVEIILPEAVQSQCGTNIYPKLASDEERETYEKCKYLNCENTQRISNSDLVCD